MHELVKAIQTESLEEIQKKFQSRDKILIQSEDVNNTLLAQALDCDRTDVAKFFLEQKCTVDKYIDEKHNTFLHCAIKLGDLELIEKLVNKNANLTTVNKAGDSPIHLAFMTREDRIVDIMLSGIKKVKKSSNIADRRGITLMHIACARNHAALVEAYLTAGVEIRHAVKSDSSIWPGYTPMHFAAEFRSLDVMKVLLSHDPFCQNARDVDDENSLDIARRCRQESSILEYTISLDSFSDEYGFRGNLSNFHLACARDDPELVKTFIQMGAAVNNPVKKGAKFCPKYTPLHFAVESNCKENVELLLKNGANLHVKNGYYTTPLHLALYNENHKDKLKKKTTIVDLLYAANKEKTMDYYDGNALTYFHIACTRNDVKVVKKFLQKGVEINERLFYNLRNFANFTALHFAALYSCKEVAELLIKHGADVNANDFLYQGTPLHLAFANGDIDMIELLLKHNARIETPRRFDKKTLLHLLVEYEMADDYEHDGNINSIINGILNKPKLDIYIEKLVRLGCDVNAQDVDGNTALHIACSKIRDGDSCARLLLKWGADINIENNEGCTPFEESFSDIYRMNASSYMMLFHHVQKLKALGMKVNPNNEECCEKIMDEKDECDPDASCFTRKNLIAKHEQRLEEIGKLKNTKINERVSLYHILFMDLRMLEGYYQNKELENIVEAKDFEKQFPWYGPMIKLQYHKAFDRMKSCRMIKATKSNTKTKISNQTKNTNPVCTRVTRSTKRQRVE